MATAMPIGELPLPPFSKFQHQPRAWRLQLHKGQHTCAATDGCIVQVLQYDHELLVANDIMYCLVLHYGLVDL